LRRRHGSLTQGSPGHASMALASDLIVTEANRQAALMLVTAANT
jgi:hypothetical protein